MGTPPDGPDYPVRYPTLDEIPVIPAQRRAPDPPRPSWAPAGPSPPRRWPWLAAGLAVGLLAGGAAGVAMSSIAVVADPPVERTVAVTPPPSAPVPADEPAGPRTEFGSGVWEVGVDIAPGKYKTSGTDGYGCYYARLVAADGSLSDIIGNGFVQGPATVTIKQSDGYFETSGCERWVRVG